MYLCLVPLDASGIDTPSARRVAAVARQRGLVRTLENEVLPVHVYWRSDSRRRYNVVADNRSMCIGSAKLYHRLESGASTTHGAAALKAVAGALRNGGASIATIVGDFAVVAWDRDIQSWSIARDALGVHTLYYRQESSWFGVASHASLLADSDNIEMEYVADYLAAGFVISGHTIYSQVRELGAGTIRKLAPSQSTERFWNPLRPVDHTKRDCVETVAEFRRLFVAAVGASLERDGPTWSMLSGGLDSSSIVSTAAKLHQEGTVAHGIGGTVTWVANMGSADEREYSREVASAYGLRNVEIVDHWPWQGQDPEGLRIDQPDGVAQYSQARRTASPVLEDGASVLLSGFGSDHYLGGDLSHAADLVAHGKVISALWWLGSWSVERQVSIWKLARAYVLKPARSRSAQLRAIARRSVTNWMDPDFVARVNFIARTGRARQMEARWGQRFQTERARQVEAIAGQIERGLLNSLVELRYPFLYRPLVEFCMALPPEWILGDGLRKLVLREAMRGILPERIRTRAGKGFGTATLRWVMDQERDRVDWLVRNPILEEFRCVRSEPLRAAIEQVRRGRRSRMMRLYWVLTLETWLRAHFGRWEDQPVSQHERTGLVQGNPALIQITAG